MEPMHPVRTPTEKLSDPHRGSGVSFEEAIFIDNALIGVLPFLRHYECSRLSNV